jgi:hypothetical protein
MKTEIEPPFVQGVRLFNRGDFFEAHELWEHIWKRAGGAEKIFYQGMIQAAAALLHRRRGNFSGAVSLCKKSHAKLVLFPAVFMGIELEQFRAELALYFDALWTWLDHRGRDGLHAEPGQDGVELVPTIRWAFLENQKGISSSSIGGGASGPGPELKSAAPSSNPAEGRPPRNCTRWATTSVR